MQFSTPMIIDSFLEGILFHVGVNCFKGAETEMKNSELLNSAIWSHGWVWEEYIIKGGRLCVTEKSISLPGRNIF